MKTSCKWEQAYPSVEIVDKSHPAIILCEVTTKSPGGPVLVQRHLFGQDSNIGVPFVCHVPRAMRTVQEALDWLIPLPVKKAIANGLDVKRQGDWFFIPSRAPAKFIIIQSDGAVLYFSYAPTRHRMFGEMSSMCNGHHYLRGTVRCPDHPDLKLEVWHQAFHRRLAIGNIGMGED